MEQLDEWSEEAVIRPLWDAAYDQDAPDFEEHSQQVMADVKKTIREKVLESFYNGQKTGPWVKKFQYKRPK